MNSVAAFSEIHSGEKQEDIMPELSVYQARREELKQRYLSAAGEAPQSVNTGGVDHLALICLDGDATI
jgi:hypothetical protein